MLSGRMRMRNRVLELPDRTGTVLQRAVGRWVTMAGGSPALRSQADDRISAKWPQFLFATFSLPLNLIQSSYSKQLMKRHTLILLLLGRACREKFFHRQCFPQALA